MTDLPRCQLPGCDGGLIEADDQVACSKCGEQHSRLDGDYFAASTYWSRMEIRVLRAEEPADDLPGCGTGSCDGRLGRVDYDGPEEFVGCVKCGCAHRNRNGDWVAVLG